MLPTATATLDRLLMEQPALARAIGELDPETLLTDVQAAALLGLRPSTLVTCHD